MGEEEGERRGERRERKEGKEEGKRRREREERERKRERRGGRGRGGKEEGEGGEEEREEEEGRRGEEAAAERGVEHRGSQVRAPFSGAMDPLCSHAGNRGPATEPWPRVGGDHGQEEALWLAGPDDSAICAHGQRLYRVSSPSRLFVATGSPLPHGEAAVVVTGRPPLGGPPPPARQSRLSTCTAGYAGARGRTRPSSRAQWGPAWAWLDSSQHLR